MNIFKPVSRIEYVKRKILYALKFECFRYELAIVTTISTCMISLAIFSIFSMMLK